MLKIKFSDKKPTSGGVVVVGVNETNVFSPFGQSLDTQMNGALTKSLGATYFTGKVGETLPVLGGEYARVLLVGLGSSGDLSEFNAYRVGGAIVGHLMVTPHQKATVSLDVSQEQVCAIAFGMLLRFWRFDKYRTKLKEKEKISLQEVTFVVSDPLAAEKAFADYEALAEGVLWARTLVAEPANKLLPKTYMDEIFKLRSLGLEVEALDQEAMAKLGMGALLGVAQGSDAEPYLGIVRWKGSGDEAPLAFVGKGVTFDTGGISLKPAARMDAMKGDMGGSAAVLGLMRALALAKVPVNAVGVVALVENMPSGKAQRPGDIVQSMSGQTIEVLNTDAEGRLILADALYYTHDRFKPRFMVDLATLTGAMQVALGCEYAGLFTPSDEMAQSLEEAGLAVGEKVWRLPMGKAYDKEIDSSIADMKNITTGGYGAGSITAAQFLGRFVGDTPWAHLDIANVADRNRDTPLALKGPTGFGVTLLYRWIKNMVRSV